MKANYLGIFLVILGISACQEQAPKKEKNIIPDAAQSERVGDALQSMPNPLEVCNFITELEKQNKIKPDYKYLFLTDPQDVDKYNTVFKKAINLGIYRTDLYYSNHHKKINDALGYLNSISTLQVQLLSSANLMQKRINSVQSTISSSTINLDSLLAVQSNLYFEDVRTLLRNQNRNEINAWIELGSWVEIAYLIALHYESATDRQLKERIAEQKIVLQNLMPVLELYKDKQGFDEIYQQVKKLSKLYEGINITYMPSASQSKLIDDKEMIFEEEGGSNPIEVSDITIREICKLISAIRAEATRGDGLKK